MNKKKNYMFVKFIYFNNISNNTTNEIFPFIFIFNFYSMKHLFFPMGTDYLLSIHVGSDGFNKLSTLPPLESLIPSEVLH